MKYQLLRIGFLIVVINFGHKVQSQDFQNIKQEYLKQNNAEDRLIEYKDSDEDLLLKLQQLDIINKSRKKHRAGPIKLDILASRVANKICKEAALNKYVGHWNLAGEKPYQRYAFAGGLDHVSENASGEMTSGSFDNSINAIAIRMAGDHNAFMAERKPNDGHKQTVIDKNHNFVGLGLYATNNQFRYYELYLDRYYEFENIPLEIKKGETAILRCRPGSGLYFNLLLAYFEKKPRPLSAREISSRTSYNDFSDEIALQIVPWEIDKYRTKGWYNIPVKFEKEGLYYIHIYAGDEPYKNGDKFTTEGKLQASGIVIKVTK